MLREDEANTSAGNCETAVTRKKDGSFLPLPWPARRALGSQAPSPASRGSRCPGSQPAPAAPRPKCGRQTSKIRTIAECPAPHADNEAARLDIRGQVGEWKAGCLSFGKVVKLEHLEVTHQDETWSLALWQSVEILPWLFAGRFRITAGALLFDDQHSRPEEVKDTGAVIQLGNMFLIPRYALPLDTEDVEEVVAEGVRLALLVSRVPSLIHELGGASTNLVPRQAH